MFPIAFAREKIVVHRRDATALGESYYEVTGGSCGIGWTVKHLSESPELGISEDSRCMLSLREQMPYRAALLEKVMADTDSLRGMRNFVWGRLKRGDATDELANRLTLATLKSRAWNRKAGRLHKSARSADGFFQALLDRENVFSEIAATFAVANLRLRVNGVERVIVGAPAARLPGMADGDQLPLDAFVSFSVTRRD
jgi:hypothetical protein